MYSCGLTGRGRLLGGLAYQSFTDPGVMTPYQSLASGMPRAHASPADLLEPVIDISVCGREQSSTMKTRAHTWCTTCRALHEKCADRKYHTSSCMKADGTLNACIQTR